VVLDGESRQSAETCSTVPANRTAFEQLSEGSSVLSAQEIADRNVEGKYDIASVPCRINRFRNGGVSWWRPGQEYCRLDASIIITG
jgi:hypothetical protein